MTLHIVLLQRFRHIHLHSVAALIPEETKREQTVTFNVARLVSNFTVQTQQLLAILEAELLER